MVNFMLGVFYHNKKIPLQTNKPQNVKQAYLPLGALAPSLCLLHSTHITILTRSPVPSEELDKPNHQEVGVIHRACCVTTLRGQVPAA